MEKQSLLNMLIQQVERSESFQNIMQDGQVTDAEVTELAARIESLMQQVEDKLSAEDFALVSELLSEISVFYVITKINERIF